jgi:glycosyltransferase involved in cell wall biosynthesis
LAAGFTKDPALQAVVENQRDIAVINQDQNSILRRNPRAEAKKRILMILQSEYPPDIRLEKEIKSLAEHGYQVVLLSNNKSDLPRSEGVDHALVCRLPFNKKLSAKFSALFNIPLFFNPVWLWQIHKLIGQYQIDLLHVHDLPLALSAIILGKIHNKPVIFDVHENYPAALKIWGKKGPFSFLIRNPRLAAYLENICLKHAQKILVVAEEHQELLTSRGNPESKVHVVGNTVDYESYMQIEAKKEILHKYQGSFLLGYVGKFGVERDLETAIRAIGLLRTKIANVRLVLVGDGPNMQDLKNLVAELAAQDLVEFTGWIDFSDTVSYLKACSICIIPQASNELIDYGVPHKLFQYMALEKPVLCSDSKALASVVGKSQCGEIFQSHSAQSFAEAVKKIASSGIPYGSNGAQAIQKKYNWNRSAKELLSVYHQLIG